MLVKTTQDVYNSLKAGEDIHSKHSYSNPKTDNKSIKMSLGRIWMNTLFPDDFPIINEAINKPQLGVLLKKVLDKYDSSTAAEVCTLINKEAFKLTTLSPSSLTIDVLIIPDEIEAEKEELKKNAKKMSAAEFQKRSDEITKKFVEYLKEHDYRIHNVLEGQIKGDPIGDWKLLLIAKGYIVDIEGRIQGPIASGLADGFNKDDFFSSAAEARRNFFMKSQMAWQPGYLARTINMANAGIQITQKDCKTQYYLELKVDRDLAKRMIGRYYKVGRGLKLVEEPDEITDKTLKFRSPMHCLVANGLCEICYGDLAKRVDTRRVGLLAGGAVNAVGINAMMKMKHKSSQVNIITVNFLKSIRKSPVNLTEIRPYLEITENEIKARKSAQITIDRDEYDEETLIDAGDHFVVPGIIDITVEDIPKVFVITLPFNFNVQLNKPNNYEEEGKLIHLKYEAGERIIYQKEYVEDINPGLIMKLFQGGAKYITQPESLLEVISSNFSDIDQVHIELIISNMFRDADDNTIPARLNNYRKPVVVGQRKQPFIDSWLSALSFENVGKAIQTGLITNKEAKLDPVEQIVLEKFKSPNQNTL